MPENAMLVLHNPSGLVAGTATDMRAMAEALDRMKAGMVAAYREKSGRDDAEIEALMAAETWLSAQEAVALGLADRVEQPVRMAAHFDLSRFRNTPPQLAALALYTPAGGEPVPVRVIATRPDTIVGFGETPIHAETAIFELRASEVANPRPGDQLIVDGQTFVVQSEPEQKDPERLVWSLDARST